jgi:hypothetical protein
MASFFANSSYLSHEVLRPLSHIRGCWELTWDSEEEKYAEEESSYAALLNMLLEELTNASPPTCYHDNEDCLAEYVVKHLHWRIHKVRNRWVGEDYESILEQGAFHDLNEQDLILAAAGRIRAALKRGQKHFDLMESSHRRMLAAVLSIVLYRRTPPPKDPEAGA